MRLTAVVGDRLYRRSDDVTASMTRVIEESITDLDDPELRTMLFASVEGNVATMLHMLRHDIPVERAQAITAATEYAIRLAQRGIAASSLRRAYHFGSRSSWRRRSRRSGRWTSIRIPGCGSCTTWLGGCIRMSIGSAAS